MDKKNSRTNDNKYDFVKKDKIDRFLDLITSLQLVHDANKQIADGNVHHIISLSGQLRALLTEKSNKLEPLLFYIADKIDEKLDIYAMELTEYPYLGAEPELNYMNAMISSHRIFENQKVFRFEDFIQEGIFLYKGAKYSYANIIAIFANRAGGAHYAENIESNFLDQMRFNLGGLSPMHRIISDIGKAVEELGRRVIERIFTSDISLHFCIDGVIEQQFCLLDAFHSSGRMSIEAYVNNEGCVRIKLWGLQSREIEFETGPCINFDRSNILAIRTSIGENFHTYVTVSISGQIFESIEAHYPVLISNNFEDYNIGMGNSHRADYEKIPFRMVRFNFENRFVDSIEPQHLIEEMEEFSKVGSDSVLSFEKGGFCGFKADA